MKNACKRLFSLMLALVLLVSVVPFQALAAENGYKVNLSIDVYETEGSAPVKKDLGNFNNISGDVKLKDLPDMLDLDNDHEAIGGSHDDYDCDGWYYYDGSQNELGDKTVADVAVDGWVVLYANHVRIGNSGNEGNPDDGKDDGKDEKPTQYFVTFQFGNNNEETLIFDVYGNIVDGKSIPDAGENFDYWYDVETGEKFNPKNGPSKNMIVRAAYKEAPKNETVEVTFIYGRNGEHTAIIPYDVQTGNITNGEPIPDAGEGFERWYEKDTGKTFNPEKGAYRNMTVIAEYKRNNNNNNGNKDTATFIFYFETKNGTRVGEYKIDNVRVDSDKDVSEKTAQEYLNAENTLYREFRGNKYEVTNVKRDKFSYDRETGNYFCFVEVKEVRNNNGGNNGNHEEDFGKDNVRVTFLYDDTNKKVDVTFSDRNVNKGYRLRSSDAQRILEEETRIDTNKYQLPDSDEFEYYYNDGKMQITIELVEKNRDNVFVRFTYDHDQVGDTVSYKTSDPSDEKYSVKDAEKLMKAALDKNELERYKLMLRDRNPVVSRKRGDRGTYTYTIALERVRVEGKLDITVYVDGDRKINDKTILVYSDETYEHDVFDWINRADKNDRKYNEYDYKIKKHEFNNHNRDLTVWLEKRHNDRDDNEAQVYLDIYVNGSKTPKTVKITDGAAADGVVKMSEAISIVKDRYTAKTSQGMNFKGLWKDRIHGDEQDKINVEDFRYGRKHDRHDHDDVHVIIKVDNAKEKTTSNSNGNPKTGDEILVTVTIMALSATALAGAYILNKKRMAK